MTTVVSLGIHIVDILGRPVTRIPDGQNVDLLEEIRITVAGTAAGASVDLAKLGARVIAMGALGKDELGNFVVSTMQHYGIETRYLRRKEGVQTSATMLPIRPNGERPALHVPGANGALTLEDIDFDVIAEADVLHVGGTSLMPRFDGPPTVEVLKFAKSKGVTTTFDLVAIDRPDLLDLIEPCLPYIDYFMPGLDEARMMCKLHDRREVIAFFLERGAKHTVFKMGAEGSSIAYRENGEIREIRLPAYRVPVVDTTGCGDAYCAGFIVGLGMGWSLEEAGRLGSAAAALVATGLGSDAGIVDLEHTIAFMRSATPLPMTQ
ncbi:carbohydrate kinase family protein [Caldilinea sp.]|jgi:sugar/nucleoside kinase (ribokinase family)|uniref:carbohydrate kinase family protein n=1 Tax=Caldilinea sp. TaxID=2293560 RepID=UPI0021DCF532|nr:sugar kinase [Caldilinea sp.]GIV69274.1 MAG: PfkB family kinase [Caldilinea sp.]